MKEGDVWVFYACMQKEFMMRSDYYAKVALSMSDKGRIEQIQKTIDKTRTFVGRILLQDAFRKLDVPVEAIREMEWDKHKKPFIKSIYPLHFNISHSGQCVVCAVSLCKIGVDVEKIDSSILVKTCEFMQVFSDLEISFINNSSISHLAFFKMWTLKESVLKAKGTGFRFPADEVNILNNPVIIQDEKYYIYHKFVKGYSFSVAASSPIKNIHFEKVCLTS